MKHELIILKKSQDKRGPSPAVEQYYQKFVDKTVVAIVQSSTTYKHIKKLKRDNFVGMPIEKAFMDITIKQWDSVTANILCHLRSQRETREAFTQAKLFIIAKLAAKKILLEES